MNISERIQIEKHFNSSTKKKKETAMLCGATMVPATNHLVEGDFAMK